MALSPDGRWLAAGGWIRVPGERGHVIHLYDFATGKLVALLKCHTIVVHSLAFSPDNTRLISGSGDNSAIIWDVEDRKQLHRLQGHTAEIYGVAFTPDGQRAVTSSYDTTLRIWRVAEGGLIAELKGHKDRVRSVALRSSDNLMASGEMVGEIRLWNSDTGQFLRTLGNQTGEVGALTFSQDGKWLLSAYGYCASCDYTQHVWEVATGKELVAYHQHNNTVAAAAISPDGRLAATGGGGEIRVWELATGSSVKRSNGNP